MTNYDDASLVNVMPITGRTHQIRVHAQYLNHAIAGDSKYGDVNFNKRTKILGLKRLFLHASELSFAINGKCYNFKAELDNDLAEVLIKLSKNSID